MYTLCGAMKDAAVRVGYASTYEKNASDIPVESTINSYSRNCIVGVGSASVPFSPPGRPNVHTFRTDLRAPECVPYGDGPQHLIAKQIQSVVKKDVKPLIEDIRATAKQVRSDKPAEAAHTA